MKEVKIEISSIDPILLFGVQNLNVKLIQSTFPNLKITVRGNKIKAISKDEFEIGLFETKINSLIKNIEKYGELTEHMFLKILIDEEKKVTKSSDHILIGKSGTYIKAKTPNQKRMVELSESNDLLFAVGPAGTGKTYTAVALAARALKKKLVKKIILTRPAVEAGEHLGFLPGDIKDKVDPFLRPLYDALDDIFTPEKIEFYIESRIIEIAPIAFMRGRTLDRCFIILDEAQNTTNAQLKMFLTRIGPSSKCIITGDLSQVDLPRETSSGLRTSLKILKDINGIGIVKLSGEDVLRHKLVVKIIEAYDKNDTEKIKVEKKSKK